MKLFKFSSTAMSLAGGLILLIYAIRTVLAEGKHGATYATDKEAEEMAVYPLAVPLMASPMGLVALTIVSANLSVSNTEVVLMVGMLLVVMVINLAAPLSVN